MKSRNEEIIAKYFAREASIDELDELSTWVKTLENKQEFIEFVKINHAIDFNMKKFETEDAKRKLLNHIKKEKRKVLLRTSYSVMKYAAIVVLCFGLVSLFTIDFFTNKPVPIHKENSTAITKVDSIQTGSDKAVLTLGDGTQIALEQGKNITLNGAKSTGKRLEYTNLTANELTPKFNYLTIPRGGQFQIKLADGTMVWLNSDSQLKYPVAFTLGEPRRVELVYGEAYFEVSPSTLHEGAKFMVYHQHQEIEVLGTEFNVKAYPNETNIYTTLVEGSVALSINGKQNLLKPNQQANFNISNSKIAIHKVDAKSEVAWVKGVFSFKGKSLGQIATVLERWYDVTIVFTNHEQQKIKFNGVLRKDESINNIMESIISTKSVHAYEINNKTITIQ